MEKLKAIVKHGNELGYIKKDPFQFFKGKLEQKDNIQYLTEEDVNNLISLKLESKELEEIRDVFVFSCLTSLGYADCKELKKEHISDGIGSKFLIKKRNKNGNEQRIPLLPKAEHILQKYDYKLPLPSVQKYDIKIKEIGRMAGIEMELHSHIGRHTCATMLLNNCVSISNVSKILGHSSTKMTEHYAKILNETIEKSISEELKQKFI
jgi:site-specific recombinase XerD